MKSEKTSRKIPLWLRIGIGALVAPICIVFVLCTIGLVSDLLDRKFIGFCEFTGFNENETVEQIVDRYGTPDSISVLLPSTENPTTFYPENSENYEQYLEMGQVVKISYKLTHKWDDDADVWVTAVFDENGMYRRVHYSADNL